MPLKDGQRFENFTPRERLELSAEDHLHLEISCLGGEIEHVGENYFVKSQLRTRFTERDGERLLNGRHEIISISEKKGVVHWGFNKDTSWIGAKVDGAELLYVVRKSSVHAAFKKKGERIENWTPEPEEIYVWIDYRNNLAGWTSSS